MFLGFTCKYEMHKKDNGFSLILKTNPLSDYV